MKLATIPTNGRECVERSVASVLPQVDHLVIVEAGPERTSRTYPENVTVLSFPTDECNISKWWNMGIDYCQELAQGLGAKAWNTAVINDDVILPPGWVSAVVGTMRHLQCAAGCSGGRFPVPTVHHHAGPVDLYTRLQGFAFVLAGEKELRADEELVWWTGDDSLGAQAALAGGMVMVPGFHVEHLYPNAQTNHSPELTAQTGRDVETFVKKWGWRPW